MKRVLFFFVLILSIHFINAQPLSQRLDALLHEEVLKTSEVGIAVFDLPSPRVFAIRAPPPVPNIKPAQPRIIRSGMMKFTAAKGVLDRKSVV